MCVCVCVCCTLYVSVALNISVWFNCLYPLNMCCTVSINYVLKAKQISTVRITNTGDITIRQIVLVACRLWIPMKSTAT